MNNLSEKTQEQLFEIENQYWVDMKTSLDILHNNPHFQRVILEGYFKDKAINGVSLLARDETVRAGERTAVMEDLIAISSLEDHFMTIRQLGYTPPESELEDQDED